ncbi:MAG: hypothetical protein ACRC67_33200 [Inquilinus sp.]|uniref:hypothetical protein n=1 Tax=Inquilinus sp. TaxID=1932117 RepID=UPI003F401032
MNAPESVADLFARWPRMAALATDLGITQAHATMLRTQGTIPVRHWPKLVAAARRRGIDGIDYAALVDLHTPPSFRVTPAAECGARNHEETRP